MLPPIMKSLPNDMYAFTAGSMHVHCVLAVVYWGVYKGIPTFGVFLTAFTHLSDHKSAGYLQALCHAPLRIPTSIFSNTPLHVSK